MAPRAIASARISFGLVSIPVKLYPTTQPGSSISFNMLHRCGSRLRQQYFCPKCEKVVARDEIVKGYEFAKDQYVTFTDEELKALEAEASPAIEISEFVPAERIDPIYFDRAYYLGPDKGADKPYRLLAEALRECGRAALATQAWRGRQSLVLVRAFEDGLLLQQLRYADEVRAFEEIETGRAELKPAELKLAAQLIEQGVSDEFRPESYADEVKTRLREVIEKKIEGEEATIAPTVAPQAQIIDLVEALKASLEPGTRRPARAAAVRASADEGRKGPKRASQAGASGVSTTAPRRPKASKK